MRATGYFVVLSAFVSILLWNTGAEAEVWDLNRCLELGLKQNPKIIAAEKAAEAAKARVVQVQSDYYPNVSIESDYARSSGITSTSSTSTSPSPSASSSDNNQYLLFLGLTQNIYDFGRREYKVLASQEDLKAFGWDLKDTRLGVIDEIRQSYYAVLLADRGKKSGRKNWSVPNYSCARPRDSTRSGLNPGLM